MRSTSPRSLGAGLAAAALLLTAACSSGGGSSPAGAASPAPATPAVIASPISAPSPTAASPTASPTPTRPAVRFPAGYDAGRKEWQEIAAALASASADGKPVLVDFGAAWCPSCRELDQVLQTSRVKPLVAGTHYLKVDTGPRSAWVNLDVAAAYGLDLNVTGIPGLVVLAPDGTVRATTNDGLFVNDDPITSTQIVGFLKPHL
ncbi:thioredoxin domain-containing protein [Streptomyces sp. TLI_171]|uniref:thioredoxin domain-containing protein n=1 Tax=Streptomyces sp. TLI_171 TaxID=1938859 RepID=UPI0015D567A2|nr:thioredoxin domain-containing protein [Streptomyces sp. TLI_171]